jgi:hypothetical protein
MANEYREVRERILSAASRMASSFEPWLQRGAAPNERVFAGEFDALMVALLAIGDVGASEQIAGLVSQAAVSDNLSAPKRADIRDVWARLLAAADDDDDLAGSRDRAGHARRTRARPQALLRAGFTSMGPVASRSGGLVR